MTDLLHIHSMSIPLRTWIQEDAKRRSLEQLSSGPTSIIRLKKQSILRKATVAYGVTRLLRHARISSSSLSSSNNNNHHHQQQQQQQQQQRFIIGLCRIDNFVVHIIPRHHYVNNNEAESRRPWNDVLGVTMIHPHYSATLNEPSFLANIVDENTQDGLGRYLEAFITAPTATTTPPDSSSSVVHPSIMALMLSSQQHQRKGLGTTPGVGRVDGNTDNCHMLGILLYELFSGLPPFPAELADRRLGLGGGGRGRGQLLLGGLLNDRMMGNGSNYRSNSNSNHCDMKEPDRKRSTVRYDKKKGKSYSTLQTKPYAPLQELGLPSSICLLVQALMDGHEVYSSLEAASTDIHLLLSDPDCFLFDLGGNYSAQLCGGGSNNNTNNRSNTNNNMQLQIKAGKLYGREKDVNLITDAFCRVSSGKNEAIFIGGYSGVGKTFLVQSLTARVDISGGYVLTQKADQMSKEKPLLDVLSAFNKLCTLIKSKTSPRELAEIAERLTVDFESDFSVLARLLPNISVVFPHLAKPASRKDTSVERIMNLRNVCFTLQRFMRIVSSRLRPVVLFMDDLQWAGSTALELIQGLLSNTRGSTSCFFFVGSYRSNEVEPSHPIFDLMTHLESCGISSTKLHLCGLSRVDLNCMISESLCIFPRICKPLSDSVHAKTKGNPFFALEFLRSLLDSAVLKYSLRERRWIWDIDKIEAENITDNALYLLSSKMTNMPENVQLVLKILSCFGIKADESIVEYLSSTSQYPDFWDWLNEAIKRGFLQRVGSAIKFVHDKVWEAAYGLIPDDEKSKFHYNLGILLFSVSRGKDLGGAIFHIIDQINHGIPQLIQPQKTKDIIELNFYSGSKAMDRSDYKTAQSYFSNSFLLLPEDHWSSDYEFSLRLYFLSAKVAYSCGNIEKAYILLKKILEEGCCLGDKLDAYHLYATILHACEESDKAYTTCREVLSQLDETIPDLTDMRSTMAIVEETGDMLQRKSDAELFEMKEMDNVLLLTLKFYTLLICISFWKRPMIMPFIGCRMIRISLEHGVSLDSVVGLVIYSGVYCQQSKLPNIREACRIGKVAMSMLKRFDSSEVLPRVNCFYYGFTAVHVLPLQVCSANLRKGFKVGMSAGDSATDAFYNSIHLIRITLLSGENLPALLEETDYHLEAMTRLHNKVSIPYLLAYRETIAMLIDKGESTGAKQNYGKLEEEIEPNAVYAMRHKETLFLNRALQSFWLGYTQRCHHYAKKSLEMQLLGRHNRLVILFYAALNAFRGVKNVNGNGSQFVKVRNLYKDAINALRTAKKLSPWNFSNKVFLLEAEMYSFERKGPEARLSYAAAITSSRSSGYVHEQGLACELAGLHYEKLGEEQTALDFFHQAKECYVRWGSQMKVESVSQQMEIIISSSLAIAK